MSDERSLPGSKTVILAVSYKTEETEELSGVTFIRHQSHSSSRSNQHLKPHLLTPSHLGLRFQHTIFKGHKHSFGPNNALLQSTFLF